jgi:hypothetical protein
MSNEAIAAVGWVSSDPMERYRAAQQHIDLANFDPSAKGAHLSVAVPMDVDPTKSSLNVRNLYSAVETGMRDGFIAPDMERLMGLLEEVGRPGSNVSAGQMNAEIMIATGKVGVAEALAKISSKTAEGLQTLVVKQG